MQLRQLRSELSRRIVRSLAILVMLVCATAVAIALFAPGRYQVGSWQISIRSLRNPSRVFLGGLLLWSYATPAAYAAAAVIWSRARILWVGHSIGRRIVVVLLVVHAVTLANTLILFPSGISERINRDRWLEIELPTNDEEMEPLLPSDLALAEAADRYADTTLDPRWRHIWLPEPCHVICFPSWAAERAIHASDELNADARVLYHGGLECMILAYELYPRRVFMLPEEQATTCEEWMFAKEKKLPIRWPLSLVPAPADREKFLREHRITHDIELNKSDETATLRVRRLK